MSIATILLSMLAAVLFGTTVVFGKLGLRRMETFPAMRVTLAATLLFFVVLTPFSLRLEDFLSPWVFLFVGIGLFQPWLSMFFAFEATQRLGATVSATVSSISPLFAMAGAVTLLGEALTLPIFFGTLGVVAGVMVLSWHGGKAREQLASGLFFCVACAAVRGFANLAHKFAMGFLPFPVMAGLITYAVSSLIGLAVHSLYSKGERRPIDWQCVKWLCMAGVGNGIAIWAMISALRDGLVVVVVPIVGSFPLFTLLVSLIWFREERITPRTLGGVFLIVPSVALIGLFP